MTAARTCLIALLALLTACATPAGDTVDPAPWRAESVRRPAADAPVWDAALPGFHLHADIATYRLIHTRAAQADGAEATLVIAIHTPGQPHLEGLNLRVGEQNIEVSLQADGHTFVRAADGTTRQVAAGTYAVVTRRDDHMHVRLTPAFLALAGDGFEIHWVDFYR